MPPYPTLIRTLHTPYHVTAAAERLICVNFQPPSRLALVSVRTILVCQISPVNWRNEMSSQARGLAFITHKLNV